MSLDAPAPSLDAAAPGHVPADGARAERRGTEAAVREPLANAWYCLGTSRGLRPGRLLPATLGGENLVLGRASDGRPFALRDRCPHRGMALSKGRFRDDTLTCPFHGWRFGTDGRCIEVPALSALDAGGIGRIAVARFAVEERAGLVWVNRDPRPDAAPPIPDIDFEASGPPLVEVVPVEATFDLAVLSLVDPAHVAHVHDSWWWRTPKTLREKVKQFRPSPYGFTMTSHQAPATSLAYRLLGGQPDIEIEFRLPGVRLERVSVGATRFVNYTFVTPVSERRVNLVNAMYWNRPALNALRPLARPFIRQFLGQDRDVLQVAQDGLDRKPTMVLLGESDLPSQWYVALKREFLHAAGGSTFVNPLRAQELRWRS